MKLACILSALLRRHWILYHCPLARPFPVCTWLLRYLGAALAHLHSNRFLLSQSVPSLEYPHHVPLHAHLTGPILGTTTAVLPPALTGHLERSPMAIYISFGTQLKLDVLSLRKVCDASHPCTN